MWLVMAPAKLPNNVNNPETMATIIASLTFCPIPLSVVKRVTADLLRRAPGAGIITGHRPNPHRGRFPGGCIGHIHLGAVRLFVQARAAGGVGFNGAVRFGDLNVIAVRAVYGVPEDLQMVVKSAVGSVFVAIGGLGNLRGGKGVRFFRGGFFGSGLPAATPVPDGKTAAAPGTGRKGKGGQQGQGHDYCKNSFHL